MSRRIKTLYEKEMEEERKLKAMTHHTVKRGDVYYFSKGYSVGVEQQGGRPGVIVSNDACNNSSEFLLVCYLTTQPKTKLPTHVPVMCEYPSTCLCEQIHTLSKEKLENYYCTLTPEEMKEIDKALMLTLNIDLNSMVTEDYDSETITLDKHQEMIDMLHNSIEIYKNENSMLEDKVKALEAMDSAVENSPEYIKVCAERDVYKELYKELLSTK